MKQQEIETLILCSVKYALGRQTYIVGEICDIVRSQKRLSEKCLNNIIQNIERAKDEEEMLCDHKVLGDDCDKQAWLDLLEWCKKEWYKKQKEKRTIKQMLDDFKKDFDLTYVELAVIAKSKILGFEKRVRRMDRIREEARKFSESPIILRALLFANHDRKSSYFDLMIEGCFDKVIENVIEFRKHMQKSDEDNRKFKKEREK